MSRLVDFHKGGENQMSTLSCSASKEREREDLLAANLRCSSYILLPPLSTLLVHLASVISRRAKATQVSFVIMCRQHRLWLFSFFEPALSPQPSEMNHLHFYWLSFEIAVLLPMDAVLFIRACSHLQFSSCCTKVP